jgi:hypothetical protein
MLCPYGEDARHVYVTRHPVACFPACVDFARVLEKRRAGRFNRRRGRAVRAPLASDAREARAT